MQRFLKKISKDGKTIASDIENLGTNADLVLESSQNTFLKLAKRLLIIGGAIALGWSTVWESIESFSIKTQEAIDAQGVQKVHEDKHEKVFRVRGRPNLLGNRWE